MSSTPASIEELRAAAKQDLAASNELQARIDQLRSGGPEATTSTGLTLMQQQHKEIGRNLIRDIDLIEDNGNLTVTDRTMLQALNAHLAVHDLQTARLAEHRDLLLGSKEWLEAADESDRGVPVAHSSEPVEEIQKSSVEDAEEDDPPPSKSTWPRLYQILDVDPKTPQHLFHDTLDRSFKALAAKHDPKHRPNDPTAEERWRKYTKAYNMLADPHKRQFYDAHGKAPKELLDFDLSKLSLSDGD